MANFIAPNPPPPLPAKVAERIHALNGSRVKFLLYKKLTDAELDGSLDRLTILASGLVDRDFVSAEERSFLNEKVMRAKVIQPNSEEIDVTLKKFDLKKEVNGDYNAVFVIAREWIQINLSSNLPTCSKVLQIWTFRTPNGQLWFAMVRL